MPLSQLLPVVDVTACCSPITVDTLTADHAEDLAGAIKALADPARLRVISMIAAAPAGEICSCDFADALGLAQPTVSHHLRILVDAGYLSREKRGTWAWYRLVPDALNSVARFLSTA